jgi:5-methyltetrahydrofolate--homocysteine methyltransferase
MELQKIYDQVVSGEITSIEGSVGEALAAGIPALEIVSGYLTPAIRDIGNKFEAGELFIPEMMLSAQTMKAALGILQPLLAAGSVSSKGRVLAGSAEGDVHDIGKWLVCTMLETAGFEIKDLGVDVSPAKFVEAVKTYQPHIVAISALLTTTMPKMKSTIEALEQADLRKAVLVMVGGAPVTQAYAESIGADGFAPDAAGAVRIAQDLLATKQLAFQE